MTFICICSLSDNSDLAGESYFKCSFKTAEKIKSENSGSWGRIVPAKKL